MIFPSVEKDRAWLRCTSSSRASCWPERQRISWPAFIVSVELPCACQEFHLCIRESCLGAGLLSSWNSCFPFLPWCGRVGLEAALPPSIQRASGNRGKKIISFFLSYYSVVILLSIIVIDYSCPEFQGYG